MLLTPTSIHELKYREQRDLQEYSLVEAILHNA